MTRAIPNRNRLFAPLVYLAALVLLFEEWCWDVGLRIGARLAGWPPLRALESGVRWLPPYPALCVFVLPGLLLFPVKILALMAIAHGHAASGIVALVVAKIGGAAVVARLYTLTLPALLTLNWFARWHGWFIAKRDQWIALWHASNTRRRAAALASAMRRRARRLLRRLRPAAGFGNRHAIRPLRILRRFSAMWRARRR